MTIETFSWYSRTSQIRNTENEHLKHYEIDAALEHELFLQLVVVVKFVLLAPATNAIIERSFSALKRLGTCIRATMGDERLNNNVITYRKRMFSELTDRDVTNEKKEFRPVQKYCRNRSLLLRVIYIIRNDELALTIRFLHNYHLHNIHYEME